MTRTSNQTEEQRKLAEKLAKEAALSVLSQTKLGEVEENKDNGDGVVDIKLEDETLVAEFAIKKEEFFKRISAVRPEFLSSRDAATLERVLEVLNGNSKVEEKLSPGCITPTVANDVLDKGGYEILVRGEDPLKRVIEIWFNGKKEMVVFVYEKPKDNKQENIKEVCINGFGENIIFNGDSVDLLKKALDKVNPKT